MEILKETLPAEPSQHRELKRNGGKKLWCEASKSSVGTQESSLEPELAYSVGWDEIKIHCKNSQLSLSRTSGLSKKIRIQGVAWW